MDRISIQALAVETIIGIHDWERRDKQLVNIDIDLFFDASNAARTDAIEDTVSYGDVARLVAELVETSHFNLIESLASAIADSVLSGFAVERIIVTVGKPAAVKRAANVSVTIARDRS